METTIPTNTEKTANENSKEVTNENLKENSDHKYNSNKDHLKNCASCQAEKKRINDLYYANNKDRILNERKLKQIEKLNHAIKDPDTLRTLTKKDLDESLCIPIERIDPNSLVFKSEEKYIFPKGSEKLIDKYANKKRSRGLILIGHAGSGKTQLARSYAHKKKIPYVFTSLNNSITPIDLLGSFTLKNNSSVFVLGNITKAIEVANNHSSKMCMLILDEINTMNSEVQKTLNENLNFRSGINIPLINKTYRLNDDSKIIVIATMNYGSYSGTYPLNLELNSRFDHKTIKGISDKEIKDQLLLENIDEQTIESLLITYKESIKAFEENKLSQPLDHRGLLKFAEDYNINKNEYKLTHEESLKESLELCLAGRYIDNKEELNFITQIIESNFKIEVDP